jgi:cell division protein FtsB
MKFTLVFILMALSIYSFSQQATASPESSSLKLQQRFELMKERSQTFKDYKVIKEISLDGFWKITMDSVRSQRREISLSHARIDSLERTERRLNREVHARDSVLAEMDHDATHLRVLGIDAHKNAFTTVAGLIILGLLVLLGLLIVRMKYLASDSREKMEQVGAITKEYDEYKRMALDKQMKLSRELQNERNKLAELGHS